MNIPNLPMGPLVDKNGHATNEFWGILSQLIIEMQQNLSNEGYKVPQQTTSTINELNTPQSEAALLYDSDTKELKVNIDGTFKVIQTA